MKTPKSSSMVVRSLLPALLVGFALVVACSDDGGAETRSMGRGSAACQAWQSAFCQWTGKCGGGVTCEQIKGLDCKSDAEAQRCATSLSTQACTDALPTCEIADLVDPGPGVTACQQFNAAFCTRQNECNPGYYEICMQQAKRDRNCAEFIGRTLAFEQCIDELRTMTCGSGGAPKVCTGVLLK